MTKLPIMTALAATLAALATSAPAQAPSQAAAGVRADDRVVTDRYLTTVQAELTSRLDTRTAHAGQELTVRVREDARLADGTRLPRGTKLTGHVIQVQATTEPGAGALLAIAVDRAEMKGSQPISVRSVIEMVAPAAGAATGTNNEDAMGGLGPVSARSSGGMDSRGPVSGGGGGVLGGIARGVGSGSSSGPLTGIGGAGDQGLGSIDASGRQTAGAIDPTGRQSPGMPGTAGTRGIDQRGIDQRGTGTLGPDTLGAESSRTAERPVVSAGENISGAPRATAVPGVWLSRSAAADASGVLTARGRNITLESGTRITLGVIAR